MPHRTTSTLCRIVERAAKLAPLPHRELAQGMVAELDAIADPAERTRFAVGAITAIAHLALREHSRTFVQTLGRCVGIGEPSDGKCAGGPSMSTFTTRALARRHATLFTVAFGALTLVLLANYAVRQMPNLMAKGASVGAITELLLLALPFIVALTIPMAVFVAVACLFMRMEADGTLAFARRERHGVRRLAAPVFGVVAVIAVLALISNTQVLPRANARLAHLLTGAPREPSSRTMTVGQLREAVQNARIATDAEAVSRAVEYEVEIQKKFALAAACLVLALVGGTTAMRFPRGGVGLVIGASVIVFGAYYFAVMTGEALADQQVISPFVGMWMANALLLGVGLLLAWRPRRFDASWAGPVGHTAHLGDLEGANGVIP